jgi:SAM-dependent methyltransferase
MRRFSPFLGADVVEVGAGIGTFSEFLLSAPQIKSLVAIEPGANTFPHLERRLASRTNARAVSGYLDDYHAPSSADSLVAVNVLEHVEKDEEFLRAAMDVVRPGGTLLLFVPAVPAIFGSLDIALEHFRRYTKSELRRRIEAAGWSTEKIGYMNLPGILSWFVAGKVLRRTSISAFDARVYDRVAVPLTSAIEDMIEMPIGQSLLAVGRRPSAVTG